MKGMDVEHITTGVVSLVYTVLFIKQLVCETGSADPTLQMKILKPQETNRGRAQCQPHTCCRARLEEVGHIPEKNPRDMGQGCRLSGHIAASQASPPPYLHDGTELGFILHLLLSNAPLHASQDSRLEEVPPVVMERSEEEFKQLSLHVR